VLVPALRRLARERRLGCPLVWVVCRQSGSLASRIGTWFLDGLILGRVQISHPAFYCPGDNRHRKSVWITLLGLVRRYISRYCVDLRSVLLYICSSTMTTKGRGKASERTSAHQNQSDAAGLSPGHLQESNPNAD